MPALNIRFTEEELAQLRERAKRAGVSMQVLAHDAVVNYADRADLDAKWMASTARVISLSQDLLARLADE